MQRVESAGALFLPELLWCNLAHTAIEAVVVGCTLDQALGSVPLGTVCFPRRPRSVRTHECLSLTPDPILRRPAGWLAGLGPSYTAKAQVSTAHPV